MELENNRTASKEKLDNPNDKHQTNKINDDNPNNKNTLKKNTLFQNKLTLNWKAPKKEQDTEKKNEGGEILENNEQKEKIQNILQNKSQDSGFNNMFRTRTTNLNTSSEKKEEKREDIPQKKQLQRPLNTSSGVYSTIAPQAKIHNFHTDKKYEATKKPFIKNSNQMGKKTPLIPAKESVSSPESQGQGKYVSSILENFSKNKSTLETSSTMNIFRRSSQNFNQETVEKSHNSSASSSAYSTSQRFRTFGGYSGASKPFGSPSGSPAGVGNTGSSEEKGSDKPWLRKFPGVNDQSQQSPRINEGGQNNMGRNYGASNREYPRSFPPRGTSPHSGTSSYGGNSSQGGAAPGRTFDKYPRRETFNNNWSNNRENIPKETETTGEELIKIANEVMKKFIPQKETELIQTKKKEYESILGSMNFFITSSAEEKKETNEIKTLLQNIQNKDLIKDKNVVNPLLSKKTRNENAPIVKKVSIEDRHQERTTRARKHYKSNLVAKSKILLNNPLSLKELGVVLNLTPKDLARSIKLNSMDYILKHPGKIPVEDMGMLLELIGYHYEIEDDFDRFVKHKILNNLKKDLPGSPVIAIVGHIDHGKTSLVENMTGQKLCKEEEGAITQKITSYHVKHGDRYIRVIDTPGHNLFKKARNLAMEVCDLVVLIVSAADGIQQQTVDSIKFLQEKNMPFITVITKIDLNRNYEALYSKLAQYKIFHSSVGGEQEIIPVSAKTSENMDVLMDHILYLADQQELSSDIESEGYGYVLDSWKDNKLGIVCSFLLTDGCIKVGDTMVFEDGSVDKVRMLLCNGIKQSIATKYDCIEIYGVDDYVDTSEKFWVCNNRTNVDKMVELITKAQKQLQKELDILSEEEIAQRNALKAKINTKLLPRQKRRKRKPRVIPVKAEKPDKNDIKFVLCGESQNDVMALEQGVESLQSDNKIGKYTILGSILGAPTDFDLEMVSAVQGYLVCFNVNISQAQINNIESKKIPFFHNNVIYKVLNSIEEYYNNQFNYEDVEEECGTAEIVAIFKVQKKFIAGCIVRSGVMIKNKKAKITRNEEVVGEGLIDSLKHEADDLKEAKNNQECGIYIPEIKIKYQLKDIIVCYRTKRIVRTPNQQVVSEKYI